MVGVSVGLGHLIVPMNSLEALMRATRHVSKLHDFCASLGLREAQLFCLETYRSGLDLHTRNICPREGREDPACGNGCGALGAYFARFDPARCMIRAEQGDIVGMPSIIDIVIDRRSDQDFQIWIGGSGVIMLEGRMLV
jgi:trans-2,3-dihydro-3-hydroxyanthranilate isomerase